MSKSDELRKRLEAANRGPLPPQEKPRAPSEEEKLRRLLRKSQQAKRPEPAEEEPAKAQPEPIVFQRDLPRRETPSPAPVAGPHVVLEEAVEGIHAGTPDGSGVFLVERNLIGAEESWQQLCSGLADALAKETSGLRSQLQHIGAPDDLQPEDLVFFDLETTGLTSSPLFLIGAMVWSGQGLVTRQFFARDYSQERAAIELFLELAAGRKLLVSFNGKSFDQPYVRTRAAANTVRCSFNMPHLDLLHVARRLWRHRVPDCKLQTLERCICGRLRHGDIPGHLIPDAYHAYVRTGNAVQMVDVLQHNFLDLVTMADLIVRLPGVEDDECP
ncbi:MAG: ribonuclease H-like domain-containing protein [Planctomycetes bacterium]|nr:ribonuclease H-like domain-containing protein [Planctomycetota bacterium]